MFIIQKDLGFKLAFKCKISASIKKFRHQISLQYNSITIYILPLSNSKLRGSKYSKVFIIAVYTVGSYHSTNYKNNLTGNQCSIQSCFEGISSIKNRHIQQISHSIQGTTLDNNFYKRIFIIIVQSHHKNCSCNTMH